MPKSRVGDSYTPRTPTEISINSYTPKPSPGASVQPKAPLAPAETGQAPPPPPAKND